MTAVYDGLGPCGDVLHTSDVPETATSFTFSQGRLAHSTGIPQPDDPEREGPGGGPPVQEYDALELVYDAAGNVKYQASLHYAWSQPHGFSLATGNFKFTWTFHDANGKPRYLQVRARGDTTAATTDYNEYWYDALGRRVLAREYSDSTSGAGTITRFAWDGDQLLRESRAAGGPFSGGLDGTGTGPWHGTRRYTQTGVIDSPLVLWVDNVPRVVVRNWRGSAAGGILVATGTADTLVYPAVSLDVQLAPDALLTAVAPNAWLGSLISEQADASGLYRRNRYYDPATGRFTQEDPIGLAGGMNLYGYGAGDPINNSDPFGLCPYEGEKRTSDVESCADGQKKEVFRTIAADGGSEGKETIDAFVSQNLGFELSQGQFSCAGSTVDACLAGGTTVRVNVAGRSLGAIAADVVHEGGGHATESVGIPAGRAEIRAWDKALNFYGRLPGGMRVDTEYNSALSVRSSNRGAFEAYFCSRYPGPCP